MSATFTFTGHSSILTSNFYPELAFDPEQSYTCGLLEFTTYNSIPNVTTKNNRLYYIKKVEVNNNKNKKTDEKNKKNGKKPVIDDENDPMYPNDLPIGDTFIAIPVGAYEFKDITKYLIEEFKKLDISFELEVDSRTLKAKIKSSAALLFNRENSIHRNFGFADCTLAAETVKISENPVSISSLNTVVIECDIVNGSFSNGKPGHSIHEFSPNIDHGFKIIEVPRHVVYLPINRRKIQSIQIRIVDQDGELLDFRGEKITCRVHIRKE